MTITATGGGYWDESGNWKPYVPPWTQPYQPRPATIPSVVTTPSTNVWTMPAQKTDEERLRFALELIADGGLAKEAMEKIAKQALRREAKAE